MVTKKRALSDSEYLTLQAKIKSAEEYQARLKRREWYREKLSVKNLKLCGLIIFGIMIYAWGVIMPLRMDLTFLLKNGLVIFGLGTALAALVELEGGRLKECFFVLRSGGF